MIVGRSATRSTRGRRSSSPTGAAGSPSSTRRFAPRRIREPPSSGGGPCARSSSAPIRRRRSLRGTGRGSPASPASPTTPPRALGRVEPAPAERFEIATSGDESSAFRRIGRVRFDLHGEESALDLFWMEGYAGGLFLPFLDATSGTETYGGGRYLLDTVKGADHGVEGGALVLDFNLAYPPSCAYDPRWVCPLAPPGSRLSVPVRAGERSPNTVAELR